MHVEMAADPGHGRPPVVLVHGVVSSRYLLPTARQLAMGTATAAVDLPGWGRSGGGGSLGIDALAGVVAATVTTLGLERPILVGHSIGAQVAATVAVDRPELLRALVLVGPTGDPAIDGVPALWWRWIRTALKEPLGFNVLVVRELAGVGPRRMLATARAAVADPLPPKLHRLAVPTLVVRGEHDRVATGAWAERVRELAAAPPVVTITGRAHTLVYSSPAELAGAITAFGGTLACP